MAGWQNTDEGRGSPAARVVTRRVAVLALHLAAGLLAPGDAAAQIGPGDVAVTDTIQEVRMVDGSSFFGRVLAVTDEHLTIETPAGVRMELPLARIRWVRPARGRVVDGVFWADDPNRTRLFFSPTARPLHRNEGYLASYMLFFPFVAYGVSDRFSVAGGTPILPEVIGRVLYVAPKYTLVSRPGMDLAVGTLAFFATEAIDEGSVGILYGVGTWGSPDQAFTGGAGWGFAIGGEDPFISSEPVFMVGGEFRTGRRTKIVSENWLAVSEGVGVITGGVRFFGERLSGDLGIGLALDDGLHCCLPVANFVYNFGPGR